MKMEAFNNFHVFSVLSWKQLTLTQKTIWSSDSQIDKPQNGRPKIAELPDVNINIGVQSIDTERTSLKQETNVQIRQ